MKHGISEVVTIKDLKDNKYQVATMYINRELQAPTIEKLVEALGGDSGFHHCVLLAPALNFIESGLPFSWKNKPIRSLDDLTEEDREQVVERKLLVTYDGHHRQQAIEEYCRRNRKQRRLLDGKVLYRIRWNLTGDELRRAWSDVNGIKSEPSCKDNLQQIIQLYYGEPWIEFDRALLNLLNSGIPEQAALHIVSYGYWGYRNTGYLKNDNLLGILTTGKKYKPEMSLTTEGYEKSMVLMSLLEDKIGKDEEILEKIQTNKFSFLTKLLKLESGGGYWDTISKTTYYCERPLSSMEIVDFIQTLTCKDIKEYYEIESRGEEEDTTATFRRGEYLLFLANKYLNLNRTKVEIQESVRKALKSLKAKQQEIDDFYQKINNLLATSPNFSKKNYTDRIYDKFKRGNRAITEKIQHTYYLFKKGLV